MISLSAPASSAPPPPPQSAPEALDMLLAPEPARRREGLRRVGAAVARAEMRLPPGWDAATLFERLAAAVRDADAGVRRAALALVGELAPLAAAHAHSPRAAPLLSAVVAELGGAELESRIEALEALGLLMDHSPDAGALVRAVVKLGFASPVERVRRESIKAVSCLVDRDTPGLDVGALLQALIARLRDRAEAVVHAAERGLNFVFKTFRAPELITQLPVAHKQLLHEHMRRIQDAATARSGSAGSLAAAEAAPPPRPPVLRLGSGRDSALSSTDSAAPRAQPSPSPSSSLLAGRAPLAPGAFARKPSLDSLRAASPPSAAAYSPVHSPRSDAAAEPPSPPAVVAAASSSSSSSSSAAAAAAEALRAAARAGAASPLLARPQGLRLNAANAGFFATAPLPQPQPQPQPSPPSQRVSPHSQGASPAFAPVSGPVRGAHDLSAATRLGLTAPPQQPPPPPPAASASPRAADEHSGFDADAYSDEFEPETAQPPSRVDLWLPSQPGPPPPPPPPPPPAEERPDSASRERPPSDRLKLLKLRREKSASVDRAASPLAAAEPPPPPPQQQQQQPPQLQPEEPLQHGRSASAGQLPRRRSQMRLLAGSPVEGGEPRPASPASPSPDGAASVARASSLQLLKRRPGFFATPAGGGGGSGPATPEWGVSPRDASPLSPASDASPTAAAAPRPPRRHPHTAPRARDPPTGDGAGGGGEASDATFGGAPNYLEGVEAAYVPTAQLAELADPEHELRACQAGLKSANWDARFEAINTVRRLAVRHTEVLAPAFRALIPALKKEVDSLRSSLAKNALMCLADMFGALQRHMDLELDALLPCLLKRAGENSFLAEEADRALRNMVLHCHDQRVLAALLSAAANAKSAARVKAAEWLAEAVEHMGARVLQCKDPERLLERAADLLGEGASATRAAAKRIVLALANLQGALKFEQAARLQLKSQQFSLVKKVLDRGDLEQTQQQQPPPLTKRPSLSSASRAGRRAAATRSPFEEPPAADDGKEPPLVLRGRSSSRLSLTVPEPLARDAASPLPRSPGSATAVPRSRRSNSRDLGVVEAVGEFAAADRRGSGRGLLATLPK